MWFLGSLLYLFLALFAYAICGWLLLRMISSRFESVTAESLCASLLFGSGSAMLLFGLASHLGMRAVAAAPLVVLLLLVVPLIWSLTRGGMNVRKLVSPLAQPLFWLALLGGAIALLTLLRYDAYNPFRDTFTYISISDFLQTHGFSYPADPNPYYPILGGVSFYQQASLRMGAIFHLAMLDALMPRHLRSVEIYPAACAIGVALNLAAIFLMGRWLLGLSRGISGAATVLAGTLAGPIFYAAATGFFPQLFGTAYFGFALAAAARLLRRAHMDRPLIFLTGAASAFLISAYSELFPFFALSVALALAATLLHLRTGHKIRLVSFLLMAGYAVLLANLEIYRMALALRIQLHVVVGANVPYLFWQFFGNSLGIYPGSWDVNYWETVFSGFMLDRLLILLAAGSVFLGGYQLARRGYLRGAVYWAALIVFAGVYFYFRNFAPNPFRPGETGQTWNLFKISQYMNAFLLLALVAGFAKIIRNPRVARWALVVVALISLPAHLYLAKQRTAGVREITQSSRPFEAYRQFVEVVNHLQPDGIIELPRFDRYNDEPRKVLAYYLYPRKLISNWNDDNYIAPWLSAENRNIRLAQPHLSLVPAGSVHDSGHWLPAGMAVRKVSQPVAFTLGEGWYRRESRETDWWQWNNGTGEISVESPALDEITLGGRLMCATFPDEIYFAVNGQPVAGLKVAAREQALEISFPIPAGKSVIVMKSLAPPVRMGNDPRLLGCGVRNLTIFKD